MSRQHFLPEQPDGNMISTDRLSQHQRSRMKQIRDRPTSWVYQWIAAGILTSLTWGASFVHLWTVVCSFRLQLELRIATCLLSYQTVSSIVPFCSCLFSPGLTFVPCISPPLFALQLSGTCLHVMYRRRTFPFITTYHPPCSVFNTNKTPSGTEKHLEVPNRKQQKYCTKMYFFYKWASQILSELLLVVYPRSSI